MTEKNEYAAPPLTDEQKRIMRLLTDRRGDSDACQVALMSGLFKDCPVAYAVHVVTTEDGAVVVPLAIIVDQAFADRFGADMKDPLGVVPEKADTSHEET